MKRLILILAIGSTLFACKNEETQKELENLRKENAELANKVSAKDSTLKLFEESFTTIQQNLGMISEREKKISLNSGDLKNSEESRDAITKDIQAINSLLADNKSTIANLKTRVGKYGTQTAGFKKMIDQLSTDVESKEEQISYLKENLTAANFTIDILNEMLDSSDFRNEVQAQMIQMQNNELNMAYYSIGTFKELKENGVLEKDGSIIGLGGSKQLKTDFNKDFFAQIDITQVTTIPLNAEKVKLVTPHPADSYTLEGEKEKTLKITKPLEFWGASKYLVIEIQ